MKEILLHICCGVCASSVVEKLREEGFKPLGFFYNPNIHPQEEYLKRQEVAKEVARIIKFELISGSYDKDNWLAITKGLEDEPEGTRRCSACFKMRLEATQRKASQMNISKFTTTLTISPHKNTIIINGIGKAVSPLGFLAFDFKKQDVRLHTSCFGGLSAEAKGRNSSAKADGFRLAIKFAKRYNLYRQNYCGCIYSKNAKQII